MTRTEVRALIAALLLPAPFDDAVADAERLLKASEALDAAPELHDPVKVREYIRRTAEEGRQGELPLPAIEV